MYERYFYDKGQNAWKTLLFSKRAALTIKSKNEILIDRSLRPV